MQKTGWTNHSTFLVWFGLERRFTVDVISRGQSTTIFLCIRPFLAWWHVTQPTNGVILVQVCSWPVIKQSFAKNADGDTAAATAGEDANGDDDNDGDMPGRDNLGGLMASI